ASAAMTVRRVSPISPKRARSVAMRASRPSARWVRRASSPFSHAIRNWRPLMVTLTCDMAPSALLCREHSADRIDGGIEPLGDLAIGAFQRPVARRGGVELCGETRAVSAARMQLVVERLFAAVGLVPAFDGGGKRIERQSKTFASRIDSAGFDHSRQPLG